MNARQMKKQGKAEIGNWGKRAKAALEALPGLESEVSSLRKTNAEQEAVINRLKQRQESSQNLLIELELKLKLEKEANALLVADRDEWKEKALAAPSGLTGKLAARFWVLWLVLLIFVIGFAAPHILEWFKAFGWVAR